MFSVFQRPSLPAAARHYPFNLILGWMTESVQPDEAQKKAYREAAQRTDVIADDLVKAFRHSGAEGRRQFAQAVEHGIATVSDPAPELVAFLRPWTTRPTGSTRAKSGMRRKS